ncbi:MAG: hypothetical protein ACK5MD_07520 [Flavobacteriales bacterium]
MDFLISFMHAVSNPEHLAFSTAFLISVMHVLSGPDHLAAVTPLVIETKRKGWIIGLFWGIGHALGMAIVGVLFYLLKDLIPVDKISEHSEQLVGISLLMIGFWFLFRILTNKHTTSTNVEAKHNSFSSLGIGLLHGLAGVSHFLLLLPTLGFSTTSGSVNYILGFTVGTLFTMTSYAFIVEKITLFTYKQNNPSFYKGLRFFGAFFSILIGLYWLFFVSHV